MVIEEITLDVVGVVAGIEEGAVAEMVDVVPIGKCCSVFLEFDDRVVSIEIEIESAN